MAYIMVAYALLFVDDNIANIFNEIIRNRESDLWKLAIEKQVKSLHQNQAQELIKLPKGLKAIGNKYDCSKK